ncbi:hypothetical protein B0J12DRAFT_576545 [Macrophomina phaseolina]|uniref:Cytochrome P450 n=1 Tax=Macrophomina phaseolina TaxID=35725 RepID=A0ABQ8G6E7_9PEZI|nr:hypothetical protein B0J12DRAFT_576545 [Macrophomina phaseolina]
MSTHSQATSETYNIYRGVWINWTHGRTLGLTLTLTRREGDLLIAFTALFVTVVGTSFWRIACFVVHSLYSSHDPRDGLYHQRQAVLRNSANGTSGLIRLVQILLAWRKNAPNPVRRVLPVICFAVLSVYGFGAASGFSSRVSTGVGNEVLISSGNCATNVAVSTNITQLLQNYWPYATRRMAAYSSYAQQCYGPSDDQKCDTFVTKSLNVQIMRNATCPFSREMCKTPDQNIFFDTGLLDTHDDLGFNTPPDQRFLYRRTTHCAPLTSEGHKSQSNYTGHDPNFNTAYMKYFYGPKNSDVNETATYKYPLIDNRHSVEAWGTKNATTIAASSSFTPIPPLFRPDADTAIIFLSSNDIGYWGPSADPWYAAHRVGGHFYVPAAGADALGIDTYQEQPFFYADEPAAALGCATQQQWCNPRLKAKAHGAAHATAASWCTPLAGYLDLNAAVDAIVRDERESNSLNWYRWAALRDEETLAAVPAALGVASLASRAGLNYGMRAGVADGQWMDDVEAWHKVAMAAVQGRVVDAATGPVGEGAEGMEAFLVRPNSSEARALCGGQKILSTAYSNFSVFGLAFIFVVGGVIVVVSWFLEQIVGFWQRRRGYNAYARLEWCANDTLQLQRLANEELGLGTWMGCDAEVPVTKKGDVLGILDLEDLDHPRLKAPLFGIARLVASRRDSLNREEKRIADESRKEPKNELVTAEVTTPSDVPPEQEDTRSVSSWTAAFTD